MEKSFWSFFAANIVPIWLVFMFSCFISSEAKNRLNSIEKDLQSPLEKNTTIVQEHEKKLLELQKQCNQQQEKIENLNKRIDSMYNSIISSVQNINRK